MTYDYSKLYGRMAEMGITREELARQLEISRSTLYSKLTSRTEFTQDEIRRCVEILRLDVHDLSLYFLRLNSFDTKSTGGKKMLKNGFPQVYFYCA